MSESLDSSFQPGTVDSLCNQTFNAERVTLQRMKSLEAIKMRQELFLVIAPEMKTGSAKECYRISMPGMGERKKKKHRATCKDQMAYIWYIYQMVKW